jgi:small subunit ribosomal protein S3
MSKVVHPYALRLPLIRDWKSRWFKTGAAYRETLRSDILLREYLEERLRGNYIADIEFERSEKSTRIILKTSRPGMVIGRAGESAIKLRADLAKFMKQKGIVFPEDLKLDILEVQNPEGNAKIVAGMVAEALERRMPFRRILKQTLEKVMATRGVKGAKISVSGRLGGADIARKEEVKAGGIPLQFMRGDVEFATESARMSYGGIGIKVWIYKGDTLANNAARANK